MCEKRLRGQNSCYSEWLSLPPCKSKPFFLHRFPESIHLTAGNAPPHLTFCGCPSNTATKTSFCFHISSCIPFWGGIFNQHARNPTRERKAGGALKARGTLDGFSGPRNVLEKPDCAEQEGSPGCLGESTGSFLASHFTITPLAPGAFAESEALSPPSPPASEGL